MATAIAFWIVASVFPEYLGLDFLTYEGEPDGLLILALIFGVINGLIGRSCGSSRCRSRS